MSKTDRFFGRRVVRDNAAAGPGLEERTTRQQGHQQ